MKSIITLLLISILVLPAQSQYSQNIDTLTRKEIRQLLINQPYSKKAKNLSNLSTSLDIISILGYTLGTATLINGLIYERNNDQDATGVILVVFGALINAATLVIFNGSAAYFRGRAKKAYIKSLPIKSTSQIEGIRKMNLIYAAH